MIDRTQLFADAELAILRGDTDMDLYREPEATEYRYYNSILWGPTYDEESGGHIIRAASDEDAYQAANRSDKAAFGHRFLQKKNSEGKWQWL